MPYIARKYSGASNGWADLVRDEEWQFLHISGMCQKLQRQTDEDITNFVNCYQYLQSVCQLNDEEIYEIGATALDCSIMLTIQKYTSSSQNAMDSDRGYVLVQYY